MLNLCSPVTILLPLWTGLASLLFTLSISEKCPWLVNIRALLYQTADAESKPATSWCSLSQLEWSRSLWNSHSVSCYQNRTSFSQLLTIRTEPRVVIRIGDTQVSEPLPVLIVTASKCGEEWIARENYTIQGLEGYGLCAGNKEISLTWQHVRHRRCRPKGLFMSTTVPCS